MKTQALALGLLALVGKAYSHYVFSHLVVNGTSSADWKYIRNVAQEGHNRDSGEPGKWYPLEDVSSPDFTCNRDALSSAAKTSTATVLAGSEVGVKTEGIILGSPGGGIFHLGPGQAYLSKAPNDDVEHYDGKGDWFKIAYAGPSNNTTWKLYEQEAFMFNIPKTTPPGKYLLRVEHIYPQDKLNNTQFYVSCAHINVIGPGGGKPTNFAKFPGTYSNTDPGILVSQQQFLGNDLLNYKPPGPPVWQG